MLVGSHCFTFIANKLINLNTKKKEKTRPEELRMNGKQEGGKQNKCQEEEYYNNS